MDNQVLTQLQQSLGAMALSDHFRSATKMVCLGSGFKRVHASKLLADDSSEYA